MDQEILVTSGHALVKALDNDGLSPRIAMWVHNVDTDTWKLWIVPPKDMNDKREFYRRISEVISRNYDSIGGIDASNAEMIADNHPAMKGLSGFIKCKGLGSICFTGNRFNGFYLPDGIILRSDL